MATTAVPGMLAAAPGRTETAAAPALVVASFASIGAGAIHAAAIGVHSEHRQAVIAFTVVALAQIGWGVVSLLGVPRPFALVGAACNLAAVGGWVLAKTEGIAFVDGLDVQEDVQTADAVAAALAGVAVIAALVAFVSWSRTRQRASKAVVVAIATVSAVVAAPTMVSAGSHAHGGGHGDGGATATAGDDHAHEATAAAGQPEEPEHDHGDAVVPPTPYDPTKPIDLSGVDGVTPEQQARAENLIAVTLLRLPKYADPAAAEADGFRSIGDGLTGYEHYINRANMADGRVLDPDYPESVVYQRDGSGKKLVAAMYMLEPGATLETVPDVGGPLTQWHIHNNLCFTVEGRVAGLTNADGTCTPPLVEGSHVPMLHVWIVPHECGPFAALEGVAGGQIREGEQRWCDHAHGA